MSKPSRRASTAAPGVGRTPPKTASPPAAVIPAASAASNIWPDSRVSRTISTCGASESATPTAACPSRSARSAVRNSPARPRTPSVPNRRRLVTASVPMGARWLALRELRPLAGLLEACLLALRLARIASQVAAALQLGTQRRLSLDQRTRDAVAQSRGLRRYPATVNTGDDVHAGEVAGRVERLLRLGLQAVAREVLLERLAVDRVDAGARLQDHAGDCRLALAGRRVAGVGGELERAGHGRRVGLGRGGFGVTAVVALLADGVTRVVVVVAGCRSVEHEVGLEVSAGDDVGLVLAALGLARPRRALLDRFGLRDVVGLGRNVCRAIGGWDVLRDLWRLFGSLGRGRLLGRLGGRRLFGSLGGRRLFGRLAQRLVRSCTGIFGGLALRDAGRLVGGGRRLDVVLVGSRRLVRRLVRGLVLNQVLISKVSGFCAVCGWSGPA